MKFPPTNTIGKEEKRAVMEVLNSGILSGFTANKKEFLGGKKVRELEEAFKKKFKMKYAVAFNSATTALETAIASLGIGKRDEVIVSPYTFVASVSAIVRNKAKPIFVDIEPETFNIDPNKIEENITKKTKAIIVVHILGCPADMDKIVEIAEKHNLYVIEDNAQSPGAKYKSKYAGTFGDVGVFSLNRHKTMQCGEGGVLVTNNPEIVVESQAIRNHGDKVFEESQTIGSNLKMTEIEAAIGIEQLKKLTSFNKRRVYLANYLTKQLEKIKGLSHIQAPKDRTHVYYRYAIKYNKELFDNKNKFKIHLVEFVDLLNETKGFSAVAGYVKPIYLLSTYSKYKRKCPVAEDMWSNKVFSVDIVRPPLTKKHIDFFIKKIKEKKEWLGTS